VPTENIRVDIINQHENSSRRDEAANVIETHEQAGDFKEARSLNFVSACNTKP